MGSEHSSGSQPQVDPNFHCDWYVRHLIAPLSFGSMPSHACVQLWLQNPRASLLSPHQQPHRKTWISSRYWVYVPFDCPATHHSQPRHPRPTILPRRRIHLRFWNLPFPIAQSTASSRYFYINCPAAHTSRGSRTSATLRLYHAVALTPDFGTSRSNHSLSPFTHSRADLPLSSYLAAILAMTVAVPEHEPLQSRITLGFWGGIGAMHWKLVETREGMWWWNPERQR